MKKKEEECLEAWSFQIENVYKEQSLERIVKVGDPPSKIAMLAEKLDVDLIMMGRTGRGNSQVEVGHVTSKVLRLTSKPVLMYK